MNKIIQGDCLEIMRTFEDNSIDSVITDPPYELGFMGKSWDNTGIANDKNMWAECLRVLKPGGHLLAFSGTRTYHRMAVAIEDAGFEIRDMIEWVYGSGFPKSLNIGKAVDKLQRGNKTVELINALLEEGKTLKELGEMAGIPSLESSYRDWTIGGHKPEERSWDRMLKGLGFSEKDGLNIIEKRTVKLGGGNAYTFREGGIRDWEMKITKGTSEWEGWGTALKPAHEPICLARKPLGEKNVAENVLRWGTGGINIDESRVSLNGDKPRIANKEQGADSMFMGDKSWKTGTMPESGRFPANLIHDNSEEVRECFPETKSGNLNSGHKRGDGTGNSFMGGGGVVEGNYGGDAVNASRFFKSIIYQAKASKSERNKGCEGLEEKYTTDQNKWTENDYRKGDGEKTTTKTKNNHPTVKPVALMEYLIKMVTREGQTVLDPFMGSGSTGVACNNLNRLFIGIERESDYIKIAEKRLAQKHLFETI